MDFSSKGKTEKDEGLGTRRISRVKERQKRMKDWGLETTEWKGLSLVLSCSQGRNKENDILYSGLRNPFPVPFIYVLLTPWQLQLWVGERQYIE